jgi:pimeloyl-ACP methyl ester carboxylesterase
MQTIISKDGTKIAYETVGNGPTILLVDGATATRASSQPLALLLSPHFTVYSYDRRGRGDSSDTQPFALEREIEDIEALIDVSGGSAFVYGMSSGGALALEAAISLKDKVKKLAVYEIPYDESEEGIKAWHEYTGNLTEAIKTGRRSDAIALFMKLVGVPDEQITGMRQASFWTGMEAIAPTLLYDAAALGKDRIVPSDRAKNIIAQVLVIDGGASLEHMPFMHASAEELANAIPHVTRQTLEGQSHDVDLRVLAPVLEKFFV